MINTAMLGLGISLCLMFFVCLYRAYKGPTSADRVVAVNMMSTKVTLLIIIIAVLTGQSAFVDVALIYAMTGFIATIGISKYIEKGKLN